jgi:urate oxidase
MVATWKWSGKPASYPDTNKKILDTLLEVFSNTYSYSVQDSLYRMGEATLATVPEISEISMACPNMHFILMNLTPFGLDNKNDVFLPTDEPYGQIECTVGRG